MEKIKKQVADLFNLRFPMYEVVYSITDMPTAVKKDGSPPKTAGAPGLFEANRYLLKLYDLATQTPEEFGQFVSMIQEKIEDQAQEESDKVERARSLNQPQAVNAGAIDFVKNQKQRIEDLEALIAERITSEVLMKAQENTKPADALAAEKQEDFDLRPWWQKDYDLPEMVRNISAKWLGDYDAGRVTDSTIHPRGRSKGKIIKSQLALEIADRINNSERRKGSEKVIGVESIRSYLKPLQM